MTDHKKKGEHSKTGDARGGGNEKQENDGGDSRTGHKQNQGHGGHK